MEDYEFIGFLLFVSIIVLIITFIIKKTLDMRNKKGVETVEFYPPEGMNPARLGYFLDEEVDIHDLIGLIVYMEHKGYLKREIKKEKGNDVIILHKGNEPEDENICVDKFYQYLFVDNVKAVALTGEHKFNIKESIDLITKNLRQDFSKKPIFNPKGNILKVSIFIILIIILFSLYILALINSDSEVDLIFIASILFTYIGAGYYIYQRAGILYEKQSTLKMRLMVIAFVIGIALFYTFIDVSTLETFDKGIFSSILLIQFITFINFGLLSSIRWRNNEYADLLGKTKGFRNFIKYAEKDRIDALAESDPQHFYDVLPYAYIFGVTDKWIKNEHAIVGEDLVESEIKEVLEHLK